MRYKILFSLILLIAIVVRFYKLGSLPNGLTWDEAAIGYNAYGILTNHRDEWLHRTPIVFQSFGDYKSPLLVYVTAISVAIFHLTPFAVRVPIALSGVGIVIVSYLLAREILKDKYASLLVMFLVAISPWAILYSRVGFEATLANFLISAGVYGVLLWTRKKNVWYLAFGMGSLALSLYAYHSPKVVVPLMALTLAVLFKKQFISHWKSVLLIGALCAVILMPLAYASLYGNANSRALGTTIFHSQHVLATFAGNVLAQISPSFLLDGKDLNFRQSTKEMGVSTIIELVLVIVGIVAIIGKPALRKYWWILAFVAYGIIPAALGVDVPHSIRSLNVLPWLQMTAGIGALAVCHLSFFKKFKPGMWILTFGFLFATSWSFVTFISTYQRVYTSSVALADFGYGYEEVIAYARSKESEVSKVYITNHFGQAYVYLLFFKRLTPIDYQGGGLANYVISDRPFHDAQGHTPALIIGTPDEVPATQNVVKEIEYPDGTVAFRIVRQ